RRSTFRDLVRNVTGVDTTDSDTAFDTELPITSSSSKRKYDNASSEDESPAAVDMSNETKRVRTGGKYHDTKRIDKSKSSKYKNQLMRATALHDLPTDLLEHWMITPCPPGQQCLLITVQGNTLSYLSDGVLLHKFQSTLPVGSSIHTGNKLTDYCILDAIYSDVDSHYYVQDVIYWRGQPFHECEAEFRYFWLTMKFQELDRPRPFQSQYSISPLTHYPCDLMSLTDDLNHCPNLPVLDHYTLIHKQSLYCPGPTPLYYSVDVTQLAALRHQVQTNTS
ncbi:hypothetical protein H4R35_006417, partial [Dimargaris xerosporica]